MIRCFQKPTVLQNCEGLYAQMSKLCFTVKNKSQLCIWALEHLFIDKMFINNEICILLF